jgi:hypothetical protein
MLLEGKKKNMRRSLVLVSTVISKYEGAVPMQCGKWRYSGHQHQGVVVSSVKKKSCSIQEARGRWMARNLN